MLPCEWPVLYTDCDDCALGEDATDEERADQALFEEMAVAFLWNWTGKNLGLCTETVYPDRHADCDCSARTSTFWGSGPYNGHFRQPLRGPYLVDGLWYNNPCGHTGLARNEVELLGPVHDIISIEVDGEPFTGPIHVENNRILVREDGEAWPASPALAVTYRRGVEVPTGGQIAAGKFACELKKAACNDRTCALPQRVQTIARQGVTVGIAIDNFEDVEKGRTGIWLIDSWVASISKTPGSGLVRSPDYRGRKGRRVVTWRPEPAPSP